jgi:hypothetical protein
MYIEWSYIAYLVISVAVTVWVATTLHRNGRVFLVEAFRGNTELADSVNHLLVVGFYLVNIGYVTLALRTNLILHSTREAIELVSDKVGVVLLVLGCMHFFNLYVFNQLRKRNRPERFGSPFPPPPPMAPMPPMPPMPPMGGNLGRVLD